MGFFKNIAAKLFGAKDDDIVEVEHLKRRSSMAEEDFGSTIIFNNGVPDYNVTLGNTGEGERVSMSAIQQTMRETDMINQRHRVGGRGMGIGLNTMAQQPAPQPMQNQQFAGNYAQPSVYQQPQQPQQVPPNYYPQQTVQQQVPQMPQQQPQGIPITQQPQQQQPQSAYYLQEPFSELIMTNDECHVIVDLPGIPKENVSATLTPQNEVSITFTRTTYVDKLTAELKAAKKVKGAKGAAKTKPKITSQVNIPDYLLGTHTVVYPIPRPVDSNNIKSSFDNGQFHIVLGFLTPLEGTAIKLG